jgi:3-polyprenyl-4-hydroxybenzoate decarboxylase
VVRSAVAPRDVRQLCAQLESRGWLHRVPTPVSADGELAEVAARSARRGGPALLFGQVEGKRGALLVDAFGSEERVALALGVGRVEERGERLGGVGGAARAALAGGVGDRLKALGGLAQVGQVGPRRVARAASGRVEARSLEELPVPSGQALESAVLFEDGQRARAVGLEIGAERSLRVLGPPAARASAAAPARIALGADPATIFAASIEVSRITSRRDPVLPWSTPGREQRWLTRAAERLFLPLVRLVHAEVVDLAAPVEGGFRGLVLASIRKEYPGQPQKVIAGLFGMMPTMQSRAVIVLDEDVPLDDPAACAAAVVRHVDWRRDVMVLDGPVDGGVATKLGVDATAKRGGAPRSPNGQHAADVAALVDRKWASYGMPL